MKQIWNKIWFWSWCWSSSFNRWRGAILPGSCLSERACCEGGGSFNIVIIFQKIFSAVKEVDPSFIFFFFSSSFPTLKEVDWSSIQWLITILINPKMIMIGLMIILIILVLVMIMISTALKIIFSKKVLDTLLSWLYQFLLWLK